MHRIPIAFLVATALLAGCGGMPRVYQPVVEPQAEIAACPSGEAVSFDDLVASLDDQRVVYLGEFHDNDYIHAFQYEMVKALHERDSRLVIAMEMFHRPFQPVLDAYVAGEITEEEMLYGTEYFSRWKYDYRWYRPVLTYARAHGIPVIGMNAPSEANRRVSRGGGLTGLTAEDRNWVARDIDLTSAKHREMFEETMSGHPMMPGFDLDAFYASQCLWEDTMAESVGNALLARPGYRAAVLVGARHVENGVGIPSRAARRGATPHTIMMGGVATSNPAHRAAQFVAGRTDYLFFTPPPVSTPPSPKLGVQLDNKLAARGLIISKVTPGGIAAAAGMKDGDRLIALNGKRLVNLEDLQVALALLPADSGTITVMREYLRFDLPFKTGAGAQ